MSNFAKKIRPYVQCELENYRLCIVKNNTDKAFFHLENAHILGQESTYWHLIIHVYMARWAIRQWDLKELSGQLLRIVGAATLTIFGLNPIGNTGGANVSPFRSMPLSPEHKSIISRAKSNI